MMLRVRESVTRRGTKDPLWLVARESPWAAEEAVEHHLLAATKESMRLL